MTSVSITNSNSKGRYAVEELKKIIAENIIELRTSTGMTQSELAEKLNYSDKSISKWERAEAVPDVVVLKGIADIFGVSVDYLLATHDDDQHIKTVRAESASLKRRHRLIIEISILGIWAVALLLFVIFWITGHIVWYIFMSAVPVSLVTFLVLHSIWGRGKYNFYIVSALMLGTLLTIYFLFLKYNWWQIFLLAVPLELIIVLCFRIGDTRG